MKKKHAANRPVFLDGPQIYLTPLEECDTPVLTKWINHPDARTFLAARYPMQTHQESDWIKNTSSDSRVTLMIMFKSIDSEDVPIGTIDAIKINHIHGTCETGANIGEKEYRGKGLGTEAKMIFLNHLFNWLNMRKVCSEAYATNKASQAYSKKCGYIEEGVLKEHIYHNGTYIDMVQLAVFKEDFKPFWDTFITEHPNLNLS